jgi:hypothetical protein
MIKNSFVLALSSCSTTLRLLIGVAELNLAITRFDPSFCNEEAAFAFVGAKSSLNVNSVSKQKKIGENIVIGGLILLEWLDGQRMSVEFRYIGYSLRLHSAY